MSPLSRSVPDSGTYLNHSADIGRVDFQGWRAGHPW
jgi:hypothetical protein